MLLDQLGGIHPEGLGEFAARFRPWLGVVARPLSKSVKTESYPYHWRNREDKMTKLQRTTFEISRAAEYFDARQLSALVGVSQDEFASVCLKELVDNSLVLLC